MRCSKCQGTGFYMGMGMIREECDCEDLHKTKPVIDKNSKAYKEAIDKIMKTNLCSRAKAIEEFETEFDKIA